jgi:hypothetical protein
MQKTPTTQAPATPVRPSVRIQDAPIVGTYTIATPMSARDLAALKARRSELSDQLESVDSRRTKLMSELRHTGDQTAIKGLEDRLALLDKRQLQLESDLKTTGEQLSSAPAGLTTSAGTQEFAGLGSGQVVAISIVAIIFVLAPLAMGVMKQLFKRAARPGIPPAALTETAQRLERLEGAVDTIALEIERISEGQRFVTKLLSEAHAPQLVSTQRSPEAVGVAK